jgi:chorismate dehydratase
MKDKISISLVSYWNTKPFLYGLEHSTIADRLDLQLDIPSVGGKKILENKVDIGLVPVAILAQLTDARIISDYCIGADNKVKSVCVFSEVPLEKVDKIFLDDHSMTSVRLLRILLDEYWDLHPELIPAVPGYIQQIGNTTAGLVIGDRAIALKNTFPHVYDLSEIWKLHTGLPFVFAAWMSRKPIYSDFLFELNEALKFGVHHIDEMVAQLNNPAFSAEELKDYLHNNISYELDAVKRRALDLFIGKVRAMQNLHV